MTGPEAQAAALSTPQGGEAAGADADTETAAGADEAAEDVPPEQTREYWQERVSANVAERQEVEEDLERLRREERAFLFSQRSTAETRREIEQAQQRLQELEQEMQQIREDARRQGVPPGWLRVQQDSGEGGGDSGGGSGGGPGR